MNKKKVHFVGIGGIGVSGLARYFLNKGNIVSGSDLACSETIQALEKEGVEIFLGPHSASNIKKGVDLVIHSPAVSPDNPEIKKAKGLKARVLSYPEALGEVSKKYYTIAVSGTHGKSTTCAMISLILEKAGLDPTVILGTKLKEFGDRNFRPGKSRYLVIEADEWKASFLNYYPQITVLTNIEEEHLDFYKDLNHILKTYKEYLGHLSQDGFLVANAEDENISKVLKSLKRKPKTKKYSFFQPEAKKIKKILSLPGEHNVCNALAALATARILGIKDKISFSLLSEFKSPWRRFEAENKNFFGKNIILISDYGHHPSEILATAKAAREKFPKREIWCVFQPHQYQRTHYLFSRFVKSLKEMPVDRIIISDIYDVAGREKALLKKKVSSSKLASAVDKESVVYLPRDKIISCLKNGLQKRSVLLVMGAGNIYNLKKEL